jgi:hypothetical protein
VNEHDPWRLSVLEPRSGRLQTKMRIRFVSRASRSVCVERASGIDERDV